jgi:hypothetical protein
MIRFYEYFQIYNQPQEIVSNCNSITVINIGTATAILDGLSLVPNAQYISQGNQNEFNESRYRVSFSGVGTEVLLVIRKIYK